MHVQHPAQWYLRHQKTDDHAVDDRPELIHWSSFKRFPTVTSNLAFDEWGAVFPNKLMGAATIDRLRDGAYLIELDGDTKRKPRPKPTATDTSTMASNTDSSQSASRHR